MSSPAPGMGCLPPLTYLPLGSFPALSLCAAPRNLAVKEQLQGHDIKVSVLWGFPSRADLLFWCCGKPDCCPPFRLLEVPSCWLLAASLRCASGFLPILQAHDADLLFPRMVDFWTHQIGICAHGLGTNDFSQLPWISLELGVSLSNKVSHSEYQGWVSSWKATPLHANEKQTNKQKLISPSLTKTNYPN